MIVRVWCMLLVVVIFMLQQCESSSVCKMLSQNVLNTHSSNDLLHSEHTGCNKDIIQSWIGEELKNIRENEERAKQEEIAKKTQQKKIELQEDNKRANM